MIHLMIVAFILFLELLVVVLAEVVILVVLLPARTDDRLVVIALITDYTEVNNGGVPLDRSLDAPENLLEETSTRHVQLSILNIRLKVEDNVKKDRANNTPRNEADERVEEWQEAFDKCVVLENGLGVEYVFNDLLEILLFEKLIGHHG